MGDRCTAVFSEDGESYRAKVILVKDWKNAAVVRFSDYGNEEEVKMVDMTKVPQNPSKVNIEDVLDDFTKKYL